MRVIVIMAGGSGERFWPLSRRQNPKQFLALASEKTMVAETVERAQGIPGVQQVYIVAGPHLVPQMREMLPFLPAENFLTEPIPRNTAPCLAFAAAVIGRRHGNDTVMGVLSADSLIRDRETFDRNADLAFEHAEANDVLVTMGIRPRHPDTGFGYLEIGPALAKDSRGSVHRVETFREKPDLETARHYVETGNFLWNSGMFFWKISNFLSAFEKASPEFATGAARIAEAHGTPNEEQLVRTVFEEWPSISIDFALMEKAHNVSALAGTFDWDDVGTWSALNRTNPLDAGGNVTVGKTLPLDTRNCILFNRTTGERMKDEGSEAGKKGATNQPILATLGVEGLVIVATDDAILVCPADRVQDIKSVLKELREKEMNEYL